MHEKVASLSSTLSTEAILSDVGIVVGDLLEWLVLQVSGEKMICSSFRNFIVPLYEFLFTRI